MHRIEKGRWDGGQAKVTRRLDLRTGQISMVKPSTPTFFLASETPWLNSQVIYPQKFIIYGQTFFPG